MLHDLLTAHRSSIVNNAKTRMRARRIRVDNDKDMTDGIVLFLEQIHSILLKPPDEADHDELHKGGLKHGHDLLQMGFTIGQVVHDYGDVCQAITQVVSATHTSISGEEFRALNLCLDNAIAGAVTEYSDQFEQRIRDENTEKLGILAHELRNLLGVAMLSFGSIREGKVPAGGSTGMVLHRSLLGLRNLIDRSLADVRLDAGIERFELISVAELIEEVEIGGLLQAQARNLIFTVGLVGREVTVDGDRQILAAVLANLLQNAFKFTKHGSVDLSVRVTDDSVLFDVRDECGGLPPGKAEDLFVPYSQGASDKSGMGLGLSICVKAARANGGEISVQDLPGRGCIFTLKLPRAFRPPLKAIPGGKVDKAIPGSGVANLSKSRAV